MKIVTAIYLNCRPDLRDEWLTAGMEQDELDESNVSLLPSHRIRRLISCHKLC
jgi:hypothetical protein